MKRILKPILDNWFLIALIALALLAIPGVILVVLRLLEWDGEFNDWLQETFSISYELRVAPWLAVVLLFFPILLVILYFLKLKRKPVQVPSTFLWKKSVEDLHVNSLFQWLRNNVLLLLQLLALLFLIYSVLGLRFHGNTKTSQHYILMIDNSASMAAKDVSPDRLTWAKIEALKEINAASDADVGMVIVFNSKATTLQTYTNDKEKLREAVASIKQTQRPTHIEEALALAESLANPVRSTEDAASQPKQELPEEQKRVMVQTRGIKAIVHLFSDGRFAKLSDAALQGLSLRMAQDDATGGLSIRYHRAGKDLDKPGNTNNLGIVGFNVLRQNLPGKKNALPTQRHIAFVRVANFRNAPADALLKLDVHIDGELTNPLQQKLAIKPRKYTPAEGEDEEKDEPGETDVRFQLPTLEPGRQVFLHAYLSKADDEFPLDDEAWLAIGTMRKAKVLIVGKSNPILDAFFDQEATRKIAAVTQMKPDDLKGEVYRKRARSAEFDLVIFDRCAPEDESDMPLANTFFIDRPPPPWTRGDKMLKSPLMMPSKTQHPLLKNLTTIWDVRTSEAFAFDVVKSLDAKAAEQLKLPDGDPKKRTLPTVTRIIETSNQTPLLFTLSRGPHTDLVLTFALVSDDGGLPSNWFGETSFPLFFRNVLYILGNVDDSVRSVSVQAGEPVVLRPEAGFTEVEVVTPAKQTLKLPRGPRSEIVFADTENLGIYRYRVDPKKDEQQAPRGFAVNLLDINESNIEPRSSIRIGNERVVAGQEQFQVREIWKWILLLAVGLLIAEWFIYHRRIAV
ncbi:MAG TPA: BatA and WFA domain-containing protein [Gemmataceae bacterium]|nr:BatA and WFA domain-containing protein [Gemmataceae bacterium]